MRYAITMLSTFTIMLPKYSKSIYPHLLFVFIGLILLSQEYLVKFDHYELVMLMLFILDIRNASSVFSTSQGGGGFDYRLAMAIPDKWIQVRFNVNFFFFLWILCLMLVYLLFL